MSCNPSRWLWGVLPVAVWSWVTVLGEHERIESDLRQRTADALRGSGLSWVAPGFSGRDGVLSGRALEETDPAKASEIARKVWGVRIVDNRSELVEKVEKYTWSAALADGKLKLSGFVPNEDSRSAILAEVAKSFPKVPVSDSMKLARGAPSRDVWLGGIGYGLKQLASLRRGSVELNGTALSVSGEAADFTSYKGVKKALQKLPQGVKLVSEKVTPPIVDPFTWSAKLAASQLVLSGYVPSEKLREDLFSQVKKSFPRMAIVDRMEIADGAPEGWATSAVSSLAALAQLQQGSVEMSARNVTLTGQAADQAIAETARGLFRKDVPKSFKLADNIDSLRPSLPTASPFATVITASGAAVRLTGSVPSEQARVAIVEAIKVRLPGRDIDDKMQLAAGAPDGWQSCLAASVAAIAHRLGAIVVDDLGGGALLDTAAYGLAHEPMPAERLAAGADLVTFSGDKLVGGPQAGFVVGRADLVARIRRDPLARAMRPDKVTMAAVALTLGLYRAGRATTEIPVWRMIAAPLPGLQARADALAARIGAAASVVELRSTVGGGSLPGETLPSFGLALTPRSARRSATRLLASLRAAVPIVVGRIEDDRVALDLRTVEPAGDGDLAEAIERALASTG